MVYLLIYLYFSLSLKMLCVYIAPRITAICILNFLLIYILFIYIIINILIVVNGSIFQFFYTFRTLFYGKYISLILIPFYYIFLSFLPFFYKLLLICLQFYIPLYLHSSIQKVENYFLFYSFPLSL